MASYGEQYGAMPTDDDPLVPGAAAGFGGWYDRVVGVIRRSWKPLLAIGAVTILVPVLVLSLLQGLVYTGSNKMTSLGDGTYTMDNWTEGLSIVGLLVSLVVTVASFYLGALGSAAGVWAITQQASGRPAALGDALRFGRTRAMAVWGWTLLAGILVTVGVCLLFIGSLYFAFATALVVPVVVYERAAGIPRSFKLTHANFGLALGRLAVLALVYLVLGCCLCAPGSVDNSDNVAANIGESIWGAIVSLPIFVVLLAGIVVTYAELRNRETPLSTEQLVTEAS